MKRVFILGIRGNMGRRYSAILKSIGVEYIGVDPFNKEDVKKGVGISDGVIIATPTVSHLDDMQEIINFGKPILCEKPFTTDLFALMRFDDRYSSMGDKISMVNQYRLLFNNASRGDTYYNYFKTGNDGLAWDCINIIGQSEDNVKVENTSPIWTCQINGQKIHHSDIDFSYVSMIKEWTEGRYNNYDYAIQAHIKVGQYISKNWDRCTDRDSSTFH